MRDDQKFVRQLKICNTATVLQAIRVLRSRGWWKDNASEFINDMMDAEFDELRGELDALISLDAQISERDSCG